MKVRGKFLEPISRIDKDGRSTPYIKPLQDTLYSLTRLSISNDTFIASGMSTYVVRIKPGHISLQKAIKILKKHNEWRRYDGDVDKAPEMQKPRDIGIAIDVILKNINH